jgi:hypothetical protein
VYRDQDPSSDHVYLPQCRLGPAFVPSIQPAGLLIGQNKILVTGNVEKRLSQQGVVLLHVAVLACGEDSPMQVIGAESIKVIFRGCILKTLKNAFRGCP